MSQNLDRKGKGSMSQSSSSMDLTQMEPDDSSSERAGGCRPLSLWLAGAPECWR